MGVVSAVYLFPEYILSLPIIIYNMDKPCLSSSSFPAGRQPTQHSQIHKILRERGIPSSLQISYRKHKMRDVEEIKKLNKQWFPVNYGETFYAKLLNMQAECWIAQLQLPDSHQSKSSKHIVGSVIYRRETASRDVLRREKWSDYCFWEYQAVHLMTLGVIDELRGKGIASKLISLVTQEVETDQNIKYIFLHVISYNTACEFYQKLDFLRLKFYKQYYNLDGSQFDGYLFGKFFNGGRRRVSWMQWFNSLFR